MYRLLFIVIAAYALLTSQQMFVVPGTGMSEPIIACVVALLVSPWIERQFE